MNGRALQIKAANDPPLGKPEGEVGQGGHTNVMVCQLDSTKGCSCDWEYTIQEHVCGCVSEVRNKLFKQ